MRKEKYACDLSTCSLCKECLPEWLPAIAAHKKNIRVKKGELIFKEGDPVEGIWFLHKGLVKVHKHWDDEKELILRFAKDGQILGHRGLGGELHYPVSATAIEDTILCYISLDFFLQSLKVNSQYTYNLLLFFADELKQSEKRMRNLAHMPVKGRMASALLRWEEQFGKTNEGCIDLPISRQDFAAYIGTSYETLFRLLNELVEEKQVRLIGKGIQLLNHSSLAVLAKI